MPGNYSRFIPFISIIGDFILLNLLFVAGFYFILDHEQVLAPKYLLFFTYLNLTWLILIFVFGANKLHRNTSKKSLIFTYVKIIVFFFFLFLLYFQVTPLSYYPRHYIKYLFPIFFAILIVWKFSVYYAFYFYRKHGFNYRDVIIIGHSPVTVDLKNYFLNNRWHGYRFIGFFDGAKNIEQQILGGWNDLNDFLKNTHVDEIYIALNTIPPALLPRITEVISGYPVKIRIIPHLGAFSYKSAELVAYGSVPVLQIHPGPLSYWYNRSIKRAFDMLLSLFMILFVVSWMTIILAVISWLTNREGVFFRQRRTCIDGKVFSCIKFRTMRNNADADVRQATPYDDRITKTGRFLRKFSLDELPQFINVLSGEMSVVGPRPHMLAHTEQYSKLIKQFMLRHTVRPGITGLAQVNGYRGEIKNVSDISSRVSHDVQYIENWSINLDLKIIFRTVWVIIRGQKEAC